jgi:hypothetical protein
MKNRILSFDQDAFLWKCVLLIEGEYKRGTMMVYQWDLQKEIKFIYRILSDREYNIMNDTDRLNSIRNLYGYLKKGILTSRL